MMEKLVCVGTENGPLLGKRIQLREGGSYVSFKGVPYAKPPVGPLRFKDAQPMESWQGVRDALVEGNVCPQFNSNKEVTGSEDCLYLNVHTPRLPSNYEKPLAVMVWIHGGGFIGGSGDSAKYGPDYFMAENVVLVTFNYRLGPLGFLYLDEASPGNYGLKDQVAAMRWVQKNIASFGGDPNNVTIFGQSAGGASVHYHMISPMSKGLFQKAIAQSGSALNPWARQTEPAETTRRLARALGCCSEDPCVIVDFLRGVDHTELVRAATEKAPVEKERGRLMRFSFLPTPDSLVAGVETFLPDPPEKLIEAGHHEVPYMTGLTSHESLVLHTVVDFRDKEEGRKVDSEWEKNVLPELRLPEDSPHGKKVLEDIRRFYLDGKPLSKDNYQSYMDLYTDICFMDGILTIAKSIAKADKTPVYVYNFTLDDELNYLKKKWNINISGACHADENGYLFRSDGLNVDLPADSTASIARKRLVRLWTNFARTGNPTPTDDPLLGVRWKPYMEQERNYLQIGPQLTTGTDLYAERLAFWEELYRKYAS